MIRKGFNSIYLAHLLREKAIRLDSKAVLISRIPKKDVAGNPFAKINCGGYGLVRRSITARPNWPEIDIIPEIASQKLGISIEEISETQIFRISICNLRCWFCFMDYRYLKGDLLLGRFFTADQLWDLYLQEDKQAKVICLTGGQPDLIPEWTLWMMQALERRKLNEKIYLWQDDNLSTEFLWQYLKPEEVRYMSQYKNYGRATCLKGYSPISFYENTGSHPKNFELQITVLKRLVKEGFDVYPYLILLGSNVEDARKEIPKFIDQLQRRIHPNIPLRIFPSKVIEYPETSKRLTIGHRLMLKNQPVLLEIWQSELEKRFSAKERLLPKSQISLN